MKKSIFILYIFVFIFTNPNLIFGVEKYKLLIPGEVFKNENQMYNEIQNFNKSGINYFEWRTKKCYRQAFVNFQRSKLCTHDPHMCAQDFAVEEMSYFQQYKKWLKEISKLCADGYLITEADSKFIKKPLQSEFDRFVEFIKLNKEKIDYSKNPLEETLPKKKIDETKNIRTNQGAHGAISLPENNLSELEKEKEIEREQLRLNKEMKIIKFEKQILTYKKEIRELRTNFDQMILDIEKKIFDTEKKINSVQKELDVKN
mgnify:CR=1 FL=1